MLEALKVSVANFSRTPGGRFRRHGPFSGEEFREVILNNVLRRVQETGQTIEIDFDGVAGMPSSFLEEAFGGLVRRNLQVVNIAKRLKFTATEPALQPYITLAQRYVREAAEHVGAD